MTDRTVPAPRESLLPLLGLCLILVVHGLALDARFQHLAYDDAYISFRYARNWVDGHGIVFNPNEWVEGYSNFLWVAVVAGGLRLSLDPVMLSKLLGLLCALGILGLLWCSARRVFGLDLPVRLLLGALLVTSSAFASAAMSGMETCLFSLLCLAGLAAFWAPGPHRFLLSAPLWGLASLTRFEGALLFVCALPFCRVSGRRWSKIALWFALYAVPVGGWFLWRWDYYGELLPNTFHAKVGWSAAQALRGVEYALSFLKSHLCLSGGLALTLVWALRRIRHDPAARQVALLTMSYTLYIVLVGGDWPYAHRFFVPVLPWMLLLLGIGWDGLLQAWPRSRGFWARPDWQRGMVALVAILHLASSSYWGEWRRMLPLEARRNQTRLAMARWLHDQKLPGATVAVGDIGIIGYYSGLHIIDVFGLTDAHIGRIEVPLGRGVAGHEKRDWAYVLGRRPTFLLNHTQRLAEDPILRREYVPYTIPSVGRTIFVHRNALADLRL